MECLWDQITTECHFLLAAHLRLKGRAGGFVQAAFSTICTKVQRNSNAYTDSFFTYGVWAVKKKKDQEQMSTMNSLRIL